MAIGIQIQIGRRWHIPNTFIRTKQICSKIYRQSGIIGSPHGNKWKLAMGDSAIPNWASTYRARLCNSQLAVVLSATDSRVLSASQVVCLSGRLLWIAIIMTLRLMQIRS